MQKRNIFLAFALFLSVLVMAGGKTKNKEIYLQLYSVRDDIKKDFKGTVASVAKMGFTGIEAAGYGDGQFYGLSPEDFKKEIESTGMKVLSSHLNKRLKDDIADTDWNEIWQWWDVAIDAHKRAGMKYVVVPSMPRLKTLADLKAYCDYYNMI
jgi:sugar phosphate isomerase/epimerase